MGTAGCEVKIRAREQRMGTKTRRGCGNEAAAGSKRAETSSVMVVVLVQDSC